MSPSARRERCDLTTTTESTRSTVQQFYRRLGAGDVDGVVALFAPVVDWSIPGAAEIPWTGPRHSVEEVREFFESFPTHLEAGEFDVTDLVVDGQDAIALGRFAQTVRRTGRVFASAFAFRFTVEAGLITRYHAYEDSHALAQAFA